MWKAKFTKQCTKKSIVRDILSTLNYTFMSFTNDSSSNVSSSFALLNSSRTHTISRRTSTLETHETHETLVTLEIPETLTIRIHGCVTMPVL